MPPCPSAPLSRRERGHCSGALGGRTWELGSSAGLEYEDRLPLPPGTVDPTSPLLQASPRWGAQGLLGLWSHIGQAAPAPGAASLPLLEPQSFACPETRTSTQRSVQSKIYSCTSLPCTRHFPAHLAYTVNKPPAKQQRCPSAVPAVGSPSTPVCPLPSPAGMPQAGQAARGVRALSLCP